MRLEHEFTVPVPVADAWRVLLDVERVAPCVPGATLTRYDGDELAGTVKVKVGPMQLVYRGTGQITTRDEANRVLRLEASGKENRGTGTAKAIMTGSLSPDGEHTLVRVVTELAVTGRPAQLGGAVVAEVGQKLIDRFAAALAEELATGGTAPATTQAANSAASPVPHQAAPTDSPAVVSSRLHAEPTDLREAEPVDLLDVAAGPMLRRIVLPAAVGAAALAVAALLWRRRGRH